MPARWLALCLAACLTACLAAPAVARDDPPAAEKRFSRDTVVALARTLAATPYVPPPSTPATLASLDYDTYRQIRYARSEAIWGASRTRFAVELFAPGFLYRDLIDIHVVENGVARPVRIEANSFETPSEDITTALVGAGQYAGFRLHYPLNREDYRDEFLVFQGASYFRGVSAGQAYGLSARGLAIDVGEPTGEEFPVFRAFWIERPAAQSNGIVVHATLDSRRVAGAYTFRIYPGEVLTMDVTATLFPREALDHVGIAPLTSMFLHGPSDPPQRPDYRPGVHDSEALAIHAANGEYVWRPLQNPPTLQFSAFLGETAPRGFGLIQRHRDFAAYQDLEARYERRPSAWVAPDGDGFGPGAVTLVEIPTPGEVNDNIVAYFRPQQPLQAGARYDIGYRLTWPDTVRARQPAALAGVVRTARGRKLGEATREELVIDYAVPAGTDLDALVDGLTLDVAAPERLALVSRVQANPNTPGFRVFLEFEPPTRSVAELRVQPMRQGAPAGETWLYRLVP